MKKMNLNEETLFKNTIYRGKILNLRVDMAGLPDGRQAPREFVEHHGGVTVAAITDNNEVYFVKQFRYPYMDVILELPAGKLEAGEKPLAAGKRELLEEVGIRADHYLNLGEFYPSPGYTNEIIYLYCARGLHEFEQKLDEDEFLNVEKIPLNDAVEMVLNGEIKDGKTQAVILKLSLLSARAAESNI